MTAIIGFVNQDSIILASDSQMSSYPYSTAKQVGYPKLGAIKFAESGYALIAKAGVLMTANHFEELFAEEAAKVTPNTPRFISDLAERVMKQVRSKINGVFLEAGPWTDESKWKRLADYNCEIVIAYFFEGQPHIYVLTLENCVTDPQKQPFAAIGCAANVSASILSGFDLKGMPHEQAAALAVYTIDACRRNDLACGGSVQMAVIGKYPTVSPFFFESEVLEDYERAAARTGARNREELKKNLAADFRDIRVTENKVKWMTASGILSAYNAVFMPPPLDPYNALAERHPPSPTRGPSLLPPSQE